MAVRGGTWVSKRPSASGSSAAGTSSSSYMNGLRKLRSVRVLGCADVDQARAEAAAQVPRPACLRVGRRAVGRRVGRDRRQHHAAARARRGVASPPGPGQARLCRKAALGNARRGGQGDGGRAAGPSPARLCHRHLPRRARPDRQSRDRRRADRRADRILGRDTPQPRRGVAPRPDLPLQKGRRPAPRPRPLLRRRTSSIASGR